MVPAMMAVANTGPFLLCMSPAHIQTKLRLCCLQIFIKKFPGLLNKKKSENDARFLRLPGGNVAAELGTGRFKRASREEWGTDIEERDVGCGGA